MNPPMACPWTPLRPAHIRPPFWYRIGRKARMRHTELTDLSLRDLWPLTAQQSVQNCSGACAADTEMAQIFYTRPPSPAQLGFGLTRERLPLHGIGYVRSVPDGFCSDRPCLDSTVTERLASDETVDETLLSCFPNLSGGERGGLCVTLLQ